MKFGTSLVPYFKIIRGTSEKPQSCHNGTFNTGASAAGNYRLSSWGSNINEDFGSFSAEDVLVWVYVCIVMLPVI